MRKKVVVIGPYVQMRITRFAAQQLDKLREQVEKEVHDNPHKYPLVAGKRLTISDIVILLCERASYDRA